MSDLIRRQDAIDRIRGTGYADQIKENVIMILMCLPSAEPEKVCVVKATLSEEQIREAFEKAKSEIVQVLPTAEPRPRWIPCSERLPEENLPVLVAVKQKDRLPKWVKEQTHSYVTDIDVYDDGGFFYTHKNNVVAWMPLPEPWKGDAK